MEKSSSTLETGSPVLLPKQTTTTTTTKKKEKKKKKMNMKKSQQHVEEPWPCRKKGVALEASYYIEPCPCPTSSSSSADGDGSCSAHHHDHAAAASSDSSSSCGGGGGGVGRTRSLTDEDLEELKGCLDLGFGFSYDEIPELCSTLPALELCYSMSQRYFLDEQQKHSPPPPPAPSPPVANWNFSSPGDDPEEVKARLKYWAQAVACTVRLCR